MSSRPVYRRFSGQNFKRGLLTRGKTTIHQRRVMATAAQNARRLGINARTVTWANGQSAIYLRPSRRYNAEDDDASARRDFVKSFAEDLTGTTRRVPGAKAAASGPSKVSWSSVVNASEDPMARKIGANRPEEERLGASRFMASRNKEEDPLEELERELEQIDVDRAFKESTSAGLLELAGGALSDEDKNKVEEARVSRMKSSQAGYTDTSMTLFEEGRLQEWALEKLTGADVAAEEAAKELGLESRADAFSGSIQMPGELSPQSIELALASKSLLSGQSLPKSYPISERVMTNLIVEQLGDVSQLSEEAQMLDVLSETPLYSQGLPSMPAKIEDLTYRVSSAADFPQYQSGDIINIQQYEQAMQEQKRINDALIAQGLPLPEFGQFSAQPLTSDREILKESINAFEIGDGNTVQLQSPEKGLHSFTGFTVKRIDDTGDLVHDSGFIFGVGERLEQVTAAIGPYSGSTDSERALEIAWFNKMKNQHGLDDVQNLDKSTALSKAIDTAFEVSLQNPEDYVEVTTEEAIFNNKGYFMGWNGSQDNRPGILPVSHIQLRNGESLTNENIIDATNRRFEDIVEEEQGPKDTFRVKMYDEWNEGRGISPDSKLYWIEPIRSPGGNYSQQAAAWNTLNRWGGFEQDSFDTLGDRFRESIGPSGELLTSDLAIAIRRIRDAEGEWPSVKFVIKSSDLIWSPEAKDIELMPSDFATIQDGRVDMVLDRLDERESKSILTRAGFMTSDKDLARDAKKDLRGDN